MKSLTDIQKELRDILPEGIDLTLQALKNYLPNGTDKYKDLILIASRYMETTRQLLQGVVSNEDAQIEFNKIRKDLLGFIDSLQESHLQEPGAAGSTGKPDVYNGEVLYRIPPKMKMLEEVKCIVRLAFDRKQLTEDLELEEHDVMKDIRISDVMGVELMDPSNSAFEIRTITDSVQMVEKDLYTEWLFYVKPILEGTHPLMLKISVIEIRDGVERKRNVVLEEKIEILASVPPEVASASKFESAGYMMQVTGTAGAELPGAAKDVQPPPLEPAPPAHNIPPSPGGGGGPAMPRPTSIPSRPSGNIRKMASALAGLVVLVIASWAIWSSMNAPDPNKVVVDAEKKAKQEWEQTRKQNTKEAYEKFVADHAASELADVARSSLDSIETATWVAALDANDPAAIQAYIAAYPNGRYASDAIAALEDMAEQPVAIVIEDSLTLIKEPPPVPAKPGKTTVPTKKNKPATKPKQEVTKPPVKTTPAANPVSPPKETVPEKEVDPNEPIPMRSASRMPVYPKCDNSDRKKEESCTEDKIRSFIGKRLRYPDKAISQRIEGTVLVEFVVERDGSITEVHSLNEVKGGCSEEAVRLVKGLPKFKPGLGRSGEPVRILYRLPIRFKLR